MDNFRNAMLLTAILFAYSAGHSGAYDDRTSNKSKAKHLSDPKPLKMYKPPW